MIIKKKMNLPTLALLAISCGSDLESKPAGAESGMIPVDGQNAPTSIASASKHALKLEQLERKLDLGEDAALVQSELDTLLKDTSLSSDERDQARFARSRALEALGDKEGALSELEQMMASHKDTDWPLQSASDKSLYRLLTGRTTRVQAPRSDGPISPMARVLAQYYKPTEEGAFRPLVHIFGGTESVSGPLGTFNVVDALREQHEKACPLCDTNIGADRSRWGTWIRIPYVRDQLGRGLEVFYFDLENNRIPARYEELLPMSVTEIETQLSKGFGLVAARERPGIPPVILIAAPRTSQLEEVETALSKLDHLPITATTIEVDNDLKPEEIQSTIRAKRLEFKNCYQELLARSPASGSVIVRGDIENGKLMNMNVSTKGEKLDDETFQTCVNGVLQTLEFPEAEKVSITYPIAFAP